MNCIAATPIRTRMRGWPQDYTPGVLATKLRLDGSSASRMEARKRLMDDTDGLANAVLGAGVPEPDGPPRAGTTPTLAHTRSASWSRDLPAVANSSPVHGSARY